MKFSQNVTVGSFIIAPATVRMSLSKTAQIITVTIITATEDIDTFYEEEVKPRVEEFDDFDSLSSFVEKKKEIFEKLELLDEDEMIITCEGRYYETIPKASMSFYFDTKTTVIGLIEY